mmetsp:Transcript_17944/g.20681  ORF Transcript_17944/g.20681 Transcript_17944/m.20681 type:complete len:240 (-) Transcript_17944:314-1033(-)
MKTSLWTSIKHSKDARFCTNRKQHKNSQHASCTNIITIQKSQSVSDCIPHTIKTPTLSSQLSEPLCEGNIIKLANHIHPAIKIYQGTNNRRSSQTNSIVKFVFNFQLFSTCKSLEATDRRTNWKLKIKSSQFTSFIYKSMDVIFNTQIFFKTSCSFHYTEQIVITAKKHMQSHFNVIAIFILPRTNFPTNVWTNLKNFNIMASICEVHSSNHSSQASANDSYFQSFFVLFSWTIQCSSH